MSHRNTAAAVAISALLGLVVVPSACRATDPAGTDAGREGTSSSPEHRTTSGDRSPQAAVGEDPLDAMIGAARRAAAAESGVPEAQVQIIAATHMLWPDSALGCPQPGQTYEPGPVPGALIRVGADGVTYRYHCAEGYDPVLCGVSAQVEPVPEPIPPTPPEQ